MKKLKPRGKEIRRIGLHDDEAISLAVNLAAKHFRHDNKVEVLEILKELIRQPADFVNNQYFAKLALFLQAQEIISPWETHKKHRLTI